MVYVDKEGQRYEYQYCVVLKKGPDAGLRQYFWASEEQLNAVFKPCSFNENNSGIKHVIDMSHYVFDGNPKDIKKSNKSVRIEFIGGAPGSLEVYSDTEEDAIKCLKYFHLR